MKIAWDVSEESVDTSTDLDEVLAHVLALSFPFGNSPILSLYAGEDDRWPALEFAAAGDRGFVYWCDQHMYGTDRPDAPQSAATFYVDPNRATIVQPRCLRLSRDAALKAVHEYLETGRRPTCVDWQR